MALSSFSSGLALLAGLFPLVCQADVDPVIAKGSKFFYQTNGTQFYMKGIAYQPNFQAGAPGAASNIYIDPLADPAGCARDVPLLKRLETNVIRVYTIDPSLDHSSCMQVLQDNGIYVIADLSQPRVSIDRNSPTWDDTLFSRYSSVIDSLHTYSNVIGFFAGNEVPNAPSNTAASAFVKAAVRDLKAYIKQKNYRNMGVGFSMNDDALIRYPVADYFNCGNQDEAVDFLGYNVYSWCGNATYASSGYEDRTTVFANYSIPIFFSEYGCNVPAPRTFTEVKALYGAEMSKVWSGGIVYEWFQGENNYGLAAISNTTVSLLPDYIAFSSQIVQAQPTGTPAASYNPTLQPQACPSIATNWQAAATPLPPAPNPQVCACMLKTLTCVVNPSADADQFGTLFGSVCGANAANCAAFQADTTSGTYGRYEMCSPVQKLSWAFDSYYKSLGGALGACDWAGVATLQTPGVC